MAGRKSVKDLDMEFMDLVRRATAMEQKKLDPAQLASRLTRLVREQAALARVIQSADTDTLRLLAQYLDNAEEDLKRFHRGEVEEPERGHGEDEPRKPSPYEQAFLHASSHR